MQDSRTLCTRHEAGACYEGCPDAYDIAVEDVLARLEAARQDAVRRALEATLRGRRWEAAELRGSARAYRDAARLVKEVVTC